MLALARYFEARFLQCGDDIGAAVEDAALDAPDRVVPDQLARVALELETGAQARRFDVRAVSGLLHPGPRRVVRAAPAVFVVEGVAPRIEGVPPAGRRDVQAAARLQVAPCGEDMHVDAAAALAVQHRGPRVTVGFQPRPGRLLELVVDNFDLRVRGAVVRRPRDHGRRVLVLELQRIGDISHYGWLPT